MESAKKISLYTSTVKTTYYVCQKQEQDIHTALQYNDYNLENNIYCQLRKK